MTHRRTWTRDDVESLGMTTDVPTAGSVLGVSQFHSYQLAREGKFPVPVLRLGTRLRVSVPALLRLLDAQLPT